MFTPPIEKDVPLILESEITIPTMSRQEEIEVRANTIKLIAELTDQEILPEEFHRQQAVKLLRTDAGVGLPAYPSETIAYLAGLVSKYDTMVVRELADLKLYTVNKLLELTGSNNEKIQLGALKLLGEIDGVDSYKKRTEITVQQKSTEEIERELMDRLDRLTVDMGDVEEAEEIKIEDIDAEPSAD
jgi:hypothetical protein